MEALGVGTVGQEGPDPAREGAGDAEGVGEAFAVEAEHPRRRSGRAEAAAGPGRMPAERVVGPIAAGALEHARREIVAGEDRHERLAARHAAARGQRADHRDHDRAGMAAAAEIVELERVRGRAVDERGLGNRQAQVAAPHDRRSAAALEAGLHGSDRALDDRRPRSGDARRERVDQEPLGEPDGLGRQIIVGDARPIARGALGQGAFVYSAIHTLPHQT